MESEHVKAGYNKAVGKAKEEIGEATGDRSLQAKGHAQQAKAKAQDLVGDAKDLVE
jgi:uncharacterized protein YjbJ (UPF0337 family)